MEEVSSYYRCKKIKHTGDLEINTIYWEKEDVKEEDDSDSDSENEEKNNTKKLIIRTYGLTREGYSVCLEITGFKPYFLLKLPDTFSTSLIRQLQNKILYFMPYYHKKDISFSVVQMKKLYYFDNYKNHTFLKCSFTTEGSRWSAIKSISSNEKPYVTSSDIIIKKSRVYKIYRKEYVFDIYESKIDTIIRFIHISKIKPTGTIFVEKKNCKSCSTRTTCQIQYTVDYRNIVPIESEWIAPFRVSSYDIECTSIDGSFPQASRKGDEIIQIGTTTRIYGQKKCCIRYIATLKECAKIENIEHENFTEHVIVESVKTERELLIAWKNHIQKIDSDVLIGYNTFGFDNKYLYDRAKLLGCEKAFSKLGRLPGKECVLKSKMLSSSAMGQNLQHYPVIPGRVQIDLLHVIRNDHNLGSYKLDNVAKEFIGLQKNDLPPQQIFEKYHSGSPDDIRTIAEYCIQDCILVNDLFDKLDKFVNNIGMSNICLVPIDLLFTRGQGIKVFSKIAEKCLQKNTAFPTLEQITDRNAGGKYEGAIVLDPEPGFYDSPIAVLDYGSLYPSTIIEHNISYETYVQDPSRMDKDSMDIRYNILTYKDNEIHIDNIYAEPLEKTAKDSYDKKMMPNIDNKGIIPSLLQDLLKARKAAKKEMAKATDPFKKAVYNGKQLALKITANSVYGYTGAKYSDLRFISLAASTTAGGRQKIYDAKSLAEKHYKGAKVIYGDTDSIFLNLSGCEILKGLQGKALLGGTITLGEEMADFITSQFRKPQVLEYEKTFWPFMIITKKRYAGNKYEFDTNKYTFTGMGLVTKRRDNSPIVKKIYKGILDILFGGEESSKAITKAVSFYQKSIQDVLEGNIDLSDLVVSKTLKTDYKNPTQIAHKVLAEKIRDRDPGNAPSSNERIPYIYIDHRELQCFVCNKKKLHINKCKCIKCMNLFCSSHITQHKKYCVSRCRICWGKETDMDIIFCNVCKGGYCKKHRLEHKCTKIQMKVLQGDLLETPSYIMKHNIKVDYRYYIEHQIKNPVQDIFDLIQSIKNKNVIHDLLETDNRKKTNSRSIRDFFSKKK
jgi:DNA polymerase delta subunit 1